MDRIKKCVLIPFDDYKEFEVFLYDQLNYPEFGWSRFVYQEYQNYILNITEDQEVLVKLRFPGSKIEHFPSAA